MIVTGQSKLSAGQWPISGPISRAALEWYRMGQTIYIMLLCLRLFWNKHTRISVQIHFILRISLTWYLDHATCFFYKNDVYKYTQEQVWRFFKHVLSIMLSLAKYYYVNFSILTMIFSVKYCKTFSLWFVKNAAK